MILQEYHSGSYGGIVTPEDIKRREEEERKKLEKLEKQKNERRCPGCDMKAFPEDSVKLGDLYYHKVISWVVSSRNANVSQSVFVSVIS